MTADVLICISEYTKQDLLAFYPQVSNNPNIHVVKLASSFSTEQLLDIHLSKHLVSMSRFSLTISCMSAVA